MKMVNDTLIYTLHNGTLLYNTTQVANKISLAVQYTVTIPYFIFLIGTILVYLLAIYIVIVLKRERVGVPTSIILVLNLA